MPEYETVIIGGGLAGLLAGRRLNLEGRKFLLVDQPLPASNSKLGGFARFSGAKFSLPPAGLGLVPVLGSRSELDKLSKKVIDELGLERYERKGSKDQQIHLVDREVIHRSYDSIVLTPNEVEALLNRLVASLHPLGTIYRGRCSSITPTGNTWRIEIKGHAHSSLDAKSVVFATGRLGGAVLKKAGATPQQGKGLDVGFRVEFNDKRGLAALASLGPDAKILSGDCRTFCLNFPGNVYRYPAHGYSVPGGVVADQGAGLSNVGVLCRVQAKYEILRDLASKSSTLSSHLVEPITVCGGVLGEATNLVRALFGRGVLEKLQEFCVLLGELGLVDWSFDHKIYLPLLDWHWRTYSLPGTFETTANKLYALGDLSGHARGLLQAAISGWYLGERITAT